MLPRGLRPRGPPLARAGATGMNDMPVDGTYVGRSQLNPLERARYDEVTWTKTQLTDKDHIRRARQGLRRFVKTALIDIEDAAAKELLFTYRRKDLDALYARRHEPMTDGLMRFKQR